MTFKRIVPDEGTPLRSGNHCYGSRRRNSWLVRALDSRSTGRGFDYRPLHCRAKTLGKLFTPVCLCSPSSIIIYLVPCGGFYVNVPACGSHSWVQWTRGVL